MVRKILTVAAAVAVGSVFFVGDLTAQTDPAATVEERQRLMRTMGGAFGPMIAVLQGNSTDLDAAKAGAKTIEDAMTAAAGLFPEGTGVGEVDGSRATAAVWDDSDDFVAKATALIGAAATVASAADIPAFQASFGALGQACGACHEGAPSAGGKYRAPK